jgi:hypothetical protein
MSVKGGPNTVTSGLVLELDAGNIKSYQSGSTTWFDKSGNSLNAVLYGSCSYDSTTNSILLNNNNYSASINIISQFFSSGSFPYFNIYTTSSFFNNITNNFSYSVWCRTSSSLNITSPGTVPTEATSGATFAGTAYGNGQYNYLIGPMFPNGVVDFNATASTGIAVGNNGIAVVEHAGSYMPGTCIYNPGNSTTVGNGWNNVTVVYTSRQAQIFLNGTLVRTGLTSAKSMILMGLGVGNAATPSQPSSSYGLSYGGFRGSIGIVSYYNKSLSAQEVLQNYNATKTRFGL